MSWADFVSGAPAISAIVQALAFAAAAGTLIKSTIEFDRQIKVSRFDKFQEFNKKLDDPVLSKLRPLVENDDDILLSIPYQEKHEFLAIYEEIALAVNSKIISEKVAFYMFGYYVIRCLESINFWKGDNAPDKNSFYWSLFVNFANRMKAIEGTISSKGVQVKDLKF